jgi:hypothetical protein
MNAYTLVGPTKRYPCDFNCLENASACGVDLARSASLPDTGSLRGDLLALVRPWVRRVRKRPYARVVAALVEETHTDPEFAGLYHERFVNPHRDPARAILRRAIEREEIPEDTNIEVTLDLLYEQLTAQPTSLGSQAELAPGWCPG